MKRTFKLPNPFNPEQINKTRFENFIHELSAYSHPDNVEVYREELKSIYPSSYSAFILLILNGNSLKESLEKIVTICEYSRISPFTQEEIARMIVCLKYLQIDSSTFQDGLNKLKT